MGNWSSIGDLMQMLMPKLQPQQRSAPIPQGDPLDYSAKYNTPIPPEKQADFDKWVATQTAKTGKNPLNDRYDYDVNGYWLSGAGTDERGHGTDLFKKPNHPTFSDESKYHGVDGNYGGKWITAPGGATFYQASPLNLRLHGASGLKQYFQSVEPDTQLLVPPQMPQPQNVGALMGAQ